MLSTAFCQFWWEFSLFIFFNLSTLLQSWLPPAAETHSWLPRAWVFPCSLNFCLYLSTSGLSIKCSFLRGSVFSTYSHYMCFFIITLIMTSIHLLTPYFILHFLLCFHRWWQTYEYAFVRINWTAQLKRVHFYMSIKPT